MTWRDPKDAPRDEVVLIELDGQPTPAIWSPETGWITLTANGGELHGLDRIEQPSGWRPVPAPEEVALEEERARRDLAQLHHEEEARRQLVATKSAERDRALVELERATVAEAEDARLKALEDQRRAQEEAAQIHADRMAEQQRFRDEALAEERRNAIALGLLRGGAA